MPGIWLSLLGFLLLWYITKNRSNVGKSLFHLSIHRLPSNTEESQDRRSKQELEELIQKPSRRKTPTSMLTRANSVCFLKHIRTTKPGTDQLIEFLTFRHQPIIKNVSQRFYQRLNYCRHFPNWESLFSNDFSLFQLTK